jgi:hypothetical protein
MEMALGAIPHPGRVLESPPKLVFNGGGAAELFMDGY